MNFVEINFDGLAGPTHNYAGLAFGNVASALHAKAVSYPKKAALQGIEKMRLLVRLGVPQGVLPPHQRPFMPLLRNLGFTGTDGDIIQKAYQADPNLVAVCYSAASMWAANCATMSPACHTQDGRVHFTPANMAYQLHRAIEAGTTYRILKTIFSNKAYFMVHEPLYSQRALGDEGAANHTYFCSKIGQTGLELFVYGGTTNRFPARQSVLASKSIARVHGIDPSRVLFAEQHPEAIDAGVFHNDVISVGHKDVFLVHERAFSNTEAVLSGLANCVPYLVRVTEQELSLDETVKSYLFNSQLISTSDNKMALIAPMECQERHHASAVVDRILSEDNPIKAVHFVDCRQSMHNGGGPACLRFRVTMSTDALKKVHPKVIVDEGVLDRLTVWVNKHYRDELKPQDLLDLTLIQESYTALDELTQLLDLGAIYDFQL